MATEQQPPRPARNTVWVQCSLPNGIDIFLEEKFRDDQGNERWREIEDARVKLNGANSSLVIGGYGLTEVAADFWEAWVKSHQRFQPLRIGAIKAQPSRERASAQAMDEKELKTGFEPLDPDKPGAGLQRVPEKEQKAALAMGGAA